MTEEGETIRNGMNGGSTNIHNFKYSRSKVVDVSSQQKAGNEIEGTLLAAAAASSASTKQSTSNGPVLGGRLQFFKGKAHSIFCQLIFLHTKSSIS